MSDFPEKENNLPVFLTARGKPIETTEKSHAKIQLLVLSQVDKECQEGLSLFAAVENAVEEEALPEPGYLDGDDEELGEPSKAGGAGGSGIKRSVEDVADGDELACGPLCSPLVTFKTPDVKKKIAKRFGSGFKTPRPAEKKIPTTPVADLSFPASSCRANPQDGTNGNVSRSSNQTCPLSPSEQEDVDAICRMYMSPEVDFGEPAASTSLTTASSSFGKKTVSGIPGDCLTNAELEEAEELARMCIAEMTGS